MSGTDVNTVTGLFQDLCDQLKEQEVWGAIIYKAISTLLFFIAGSVIVAIGVFNFFDWLVELIGQQITGFQGSDLQSVIAVFFLGAIVFGSPVVAAVAIRELKFQFAGVVLGGRFKERRKGVRYLVSGALLWGVLAIRGNLFSELSDFLVSLF